MHSLLHCYSIWPLFLSIWAILRCVCVCLLCMCLYRCLCVCLLHTVCVFINAVVVVLYVVSFV